jgi:hypothetical protein
MTGVLGVHGGAPEMDMWAWRRQMAVSPRGNGRTADAGYVHVQAQPATWT